MPRETPEYKTYSQTQGYGMVPVYGDARGREQGPFLGYEFDPLKAGLKKEDAPKPEGVLAEEKRLGTKMEPIYALSNDGEVSVEYGPPIGYRYDNGKSQYVNFDAKGNKTFTQDRTSAALPIASILAAPFLLPLLGLGGAGAAGAGATGATLGATEGALTAAQLAALPGTATGIGTLGAGTAALEGLMGSAGIEGLGMGSELAAGAGGAGAAGAGAVGAGAAGTTALESLMGSSGIEGLGMGSELATGAGGAGAAGTTALESLMGSSGIEGLGMGDALATGAGAGAGATGGLTAAEIANLGMGNALTQGAGAGAGALTGTEALEGLMGTAGVKGLGMGDALATGAAAGAGSIASAATPGITDFLKKGKDLLTGAKDAVTGSGSGMGVLGLMALASMMNKGGGGTPASTATIPELTANRSQLPYDVDKKGVNPNTPYRPGQGGVTYFSPTTYTPKAAGGGLMSLGGYSDGGRLLQGPGDGVSDSIPAIIGQKQPARLANGEFVIPARIVSELGNGSTDAGAKRLYAMMDRIQKVRRKTKNVAANTKAAKYLPA